MGNPVFIIGNLIIAIAQILNILLNIVIFLIFFRAIISWVSPDPYNQIVQFLYRSTEPILDPVRRFLPTGVGRIDFSPIIAFLIIVFLQSFLVASLNDWGHRLKAPQPWKNLEPSRYQPRSEGDLFPYDRLKETEKDPL